MNKPLKYYAHLAAFFIFLGSTFHLPSAYSAPGKPTSKNVALTVKYVKPKQVDWPQSISVNGGIFPWQEAVVAAEVSGLRIVGISAYVGDIVKRGEVLAELQRNTVEASLAQQQANVELAKAGLAEAKANANRARELRGSAAMSEQQITQYLIAEKSARASVDAAKASLKNIQIRLTQTRIVAPDNGIIISRKATLGSVVQSGTVLFRMIRRNRLEWRAEVAASQLKQVRIGQQAILHLANGSQVRGKVRMIAPTLNTRTLNTLVYVDLPIGSPARAGMFASGHIFGKMKKATILPNSAITLRDGYSFIFLINLQNIVIEKKVKTGRRHNSQIEILTPLPPQARIVASGGAFLNDGDRVNVTSEYVDRQGK